MLTTSETVLSAFRGAGVVDGLGTDVVRSAY